MTDKWVVDDPYPEGHAVPMTATEQAQFDADQQAAAAAASAQATLDANAQTVTSNLNGRLTKIRQARQAIANGTLFASLTANEKAVIDGLLEDDIYLARIALNLYDGTT